MTLLRQQLLTSVIGYLAGLAVLVMWPGRETADQGVAFIGGSAVAIATGLAAEALLFGRRPTFRPRPVQYSVPNSVGLTLAGVVYVTVRASEAGPNALVAFGVVVPLIFVGATTANWLWVRGIRRPTE
jgi:hypothetical protein